MIGNFVNMVHLAYYCLNLSQNHKKKVDITNNWHFSSFSKVSQRQYCHLSNLIWSKVFIRENYNSCLLLKWQIFLLNCCWLISSYSHTIFFFIQNFSLKYNLTINRQLKETISLTRLELPHEKKQVFLPLISQHCSTH